MKERIDRILNDFYVALKEAPPYGKVAIEVVFHSGNPTIVNVQSQRSLALNAPDHKHQQPEFNRQGIRHL